MCHCRMFLWLKTIKDTPNYGLLIRLKRENADRKQSVYDLNLSIWWNYKGWLFQVCKGNLDSRLQIFVSALELWWYSSVFLKYLMAYWLWRPTVIIRGKLPAHALLQFKELWTHILPLGCWVLILLFTFDINFHLDFLNLLHIEALVFWIRLVLFFLEVFFKWFQSGLGWPIHF